jgi:excisionase family DNA binding protein
VTNRKAVAVQTIKDKTYLSRQEASNELGVSLMTIARMLCDGRLTRYKAKNGHNVLIDKAQVDAINAKKVNVVAEVTE